MSSASCCTSRKAPSPDSLAPRPVPLQHPPGSPPMLPNRRETDHSYFSSLSTTSPLSRQEDLAELHAIFEEDKSSVGEDGDRVRTKQSSGSLVSIKNRLRKHLSIDLSAHKRQSRSSIGISEDEVQRRAELRRMRQKRIQEELSNECVYDSDARSLSTIVGACSVSKDARDATKHLWPPATTYNGVPVSALPSSWLSPYMQSGEPQLAQHRNPSSSIELASPRMPRLRSKSDTGNPGGDVKATGARHSRRHSSPKPISPRIITEERQEFESAGKSGLTPPIPPAPALQPQRLPSFPAKSSWRLSFASENRGFHLRNLSYEEVSGAHKSEKNPITTNEATKPTPQAIGLSDDNSILDFVSSRSQPCSTNGEFTSVDGHDERIDSKDVIGIGPFHSFSSLSQFPCRGKQPEYRDVLNNSDTLTAGHNNGNHSVAGFSLISQGSYMPESDQASSLYISASGSRQPSQETLHLDLPSFATISKSRSNSLKQIDAGVSPRLASLGSTRSDTSTVKRRPPKPRYKLSGMGNDSPLFGAREVKSTDATLEGPFRSVPVEIPHNSSTPGSTKFRGLLNLKGAGTTSSSPKRKPIFSRLARLAVRDSNGLAEKDRDPQLSTIPSEARPCAGDVCSTAGAMCPTLGLGPAEAWSKAVGLDTCSDCRGEHAPKKSADCPSGHSIDGLKRNGKARSGLLQQSSSVDDNTARERALIEKEAALDAWERELDRITGKVKADSRNVVRVSRPDRRYPASWSKFPSHNRSDRILSAGTDAYIGQRDSAIAGTDDGHTGWYAREKSDYLHYHESGGLELHQNTPKKGFFKRWEGRIKDRFSRMESIPSDVFLDRNPGRIGGLVAPRPNEHPGLDLLPVDFTTAAEVEDELQSNQSELGAPFSTGFQGHDFGSTTAKQHRGIKIDRLDGDQVVQDMVELNDLTPTKSIAERTEARLRKDSRRKGKTSTSSDTVRQLGGTDTGSMHSHTLQLDARIITVEKADARAKIPAEEIRAGGHGRLNKSTQDLGRRAESLDGIQDGNELHLDGSHARAANSKHCNTRIARSTSTGACHEEKYEVGGRVLAKGMSESWSPGDWAKHMYGEGATLSPRRPISFGCLRKSTDDFHSELERMERFEREKALRVAAEAWGGQ